MILDRLAGSLRDCGPVHALLRQRYRRRFRTPLGTGSWCGVYDTFAAAAAAAPARAPVGYDQPAAGAMYEDLREDVKAKDYPVLFWLERTLGPSFTVFDFGGHVGISYYAYRRFLRATAVKRWLVCDVPTVARAGEALARERGETALGFTTDFAGAADADVLLAAGSLQYVEAPLAGRLAALPKMPAHVIVNMLPTQPERAVITLQNIGVAYCPYRIDARNALPMSLARLGYVLEDSWVNPDARTRLPYERDTLPVVWVGHYFRLA